MAFYRDDLSLAGGWAFLMGYGLDSAYWHAPSPATLLRAVVGAGHAFLGGHFVFAFPAVRDALGAALPGQFLEDEIYLVRSMSTPLAVVLSTASAAIGGGLVWLLARGAAHAKILTGSPRLALQLIVVWLLCYALPFTFYSPQNVELWIVQSLAVWLALLAGPRAWILARPADRTTRENTRAALLPIALVAALLGFVNYTGSIRLLADRANDRFYARTEPFIQGAGEDDLLVLGRSWISEAYVKRFTRVQVIGFVGLFRQQQHPGRELAVAKVAVEETLARGGRVFVSDEAVELDANSIRELGAERTAEIGRFWQPYRDRWERREAPAGTYYVLRSGSVPGRRSGPGRSP
jgi:hypothetical protein